MIYIISRKRQKIYVAPPGHRTAYVRDPTKAWMFPTKTAANAERRFNESVVSYTLDHTTSSGLPATV